MWYSLKNYNTIIFDVDGTLLDTSEGIISSVNYTIENMGLPDLSNEEKEAFIGPLIHNSFRNKYGLNDEDTYKAAKIFRERYSTIDLCKAKLYDGVLELLKYLKTNGYKIGVATYKREDYALKILNEFGITPFCDCIMGSDFYGKLTKHDIINNCINKIGSNRSEILMIGDTDADKIGAEKAGIDFLAVTYGFGFKISDNISNAVSCCCDIKNFLV